MEGTIGEIRLFAASFAPKNWSYCNGLLIAIRSNTPLFSVIGTVYGGDGVNTFALPNLLSRSAVCIGQGPDTSSYVLGQMSGVYDTRLLQQNLAGHTHPLTTNVSIPAFSEPGNTVATNAYPASYPGAYSADADVAMKSFTLNAAASATGGNTPVSIMQPILGMNYIICLTGVFPSRG